MNEIAPVEMRPSARAGSLCELPVGWAGEDGQRHASARLRKMTGAEEAILADPKLRQNTGRLVTELLASCVREIEGAPPVTPKLTAALSSADRNFLLLELRRITFGDRIEARYACQACGERFETDEDLAEFEVRRAEEDGPLEIVVDLEDGWEDRDGEVHTRATFRLPTGEDEEKAAPAMKLNASRGVNTLLARCLTALGTVPAQKLKGLGPRVFSDMTMGDRALIERAMRSQTPGVDLRHRVECPACGQSFEASLDMTNFFSPR